MTVILEWIRRILRIGLLDFLASLSWKAVAGVIFTLVVGAVILGVLVLLLIGAVL